MIIIVSGEGSSDIGSCNNGQGECVGNDFRPGPMAVIIDKLIEPITGYSLLSSQAMEFVGEQSLHRQAKTLPMTLSIGKKRDYESGCAFKEARALGRLAAQKSEVNQCSVCAVLFRDADGTQSTRRGLFETKWKAISDGFNAEGFSRGVPMVPNPKSEAWLICALKEYSYQHCDQLETTLSGNDDSPNPAKKQLDLLLTAQGRGVDDLSGMVLGDVICATRIDMPSYDRFRKRLENVVSEACGKPPPHPN